VHNQSCLDDAIKTTYWGGGPLECAEVCMAAGQKYTVSAMLYFDACLCFPHAPSCLISQSPCQDPTTSCLGKPSCVFDAFNISALVPPTPSIAWIQKCNRQNPTNFISNFTHGKSIPPMNSFSQSQTDYVYCSEDMKNASVLSIYSYTIIQTEKNESWVWHSYDVIPLYQCGTRAGYLVACGPDPRPTVAPVADAQTKPNDDSAILPLAIILPVVFVLLISVIYYVYRGRKLKGQGANAEERKKEAINNAPDSSLPVDTSAIPNTSAPDSSLPVDTSTSPDTSDVQVDGR